MAFNPAVLNKLTELKAHIPFLEKVISKLELKSDQGANLQRLKDMHQYLTNKDPKMMNINVLNAFDGVIKVILKTAVKSNPCESESQKAGNVKSPNIQILDVVPDAKADNQTKSSLHENICKKKIDDKYHYNEKRYEDYHLTKSSSKGHGSSSGEQQTHYRSSYREHGSHHRSNSYHRSSSREHRSHRSSGSRDYSPRYRSSREDHRPSSREYRSSSGESSQDKITTKDYLISSNKELTKENIDRNSSSSTKENSTETPLETTSSNYSKVTYEKNLFSDALMSGYSEKNLLSQSKDNTPISSKKSLLELPMPPVYPDDSQNKSILPASSRWEVAERKSMSRFDDQGISKDSMEQISNFKRNSFEFSSSTSSTGFSAKDRLLKNVCTEMYTAKNKQLDAPTYRPDVPLPSYPNLSQNVIPDTPQSPDEASFSPPPNDEVVKSIPLERVSSKDISSIINNTSLRDMAAIQQALKTINSSEVPNKSEPHKVPYRYEDFIGPISSSQNSDDWQSVNYANKLPFCGKDLDLRGKQDVDLRQIPGNYGARTSVHPFSSNVLHSNTSRNLSRDIDMRNINPNVGQANVPISSKNNLTAVPVQIKENNPKSIAGSVTKPEEILAKSYSPSTSLNSQPAKTSAPNIVGSKFKSCPFPSNTNNESEVSGSNIKESSSRPVTPFLPHKSKGNLSIPLPSSTSTNIKEDFPKTVTHHLSSNNNTPRSIPPPPPNFKQLVNERAKNLKSSTDNQILKSHSNTETSKFQIIPSNKSSSKINIPLFKSQNLANTTDPTVQPSFCNKSANTTTKLSRQLDNTQNQETLNKFHFDFNDNTPLSTSEGDSKESESKLLHCETTSNLPTTLLTIPNIPLPSKPTDSFPKDVPSLKNKSAIQSGVIDKGSTCFYSNKAEFGKYRQPTKQTTSSAIDNKEVSAHPDPIIQQSVKHVEISKINKDSAHSVSNRIEHNPREFIKLGQKGVAVSQMESYKQKRERFNSNLSGGSENNFGISKLPRNKEEQKPLLTTPKANSLPQSSQNRGSETECSNPPKRLQSSNFQSSQGFRPAANVSNKLQDHSIGNFPRGQTKFHSNLNDPRLAENSSDYKLWAHEPAKKDPRLQSSQLPNDPRTMNRIPFAQKDPRLMNSRDKSNYQASQPPDLFKNASSSSQIRSSYGPNSHYSDNFGYKGLMNHPQTSTFQQPIGPPQVAKDSLIGNTFTCLMMSGVPPFANSSHIYRFFEEYILRDFCIELDDTYNCKGVAYIHFPNHWSAKEALQKLHGNPIDNCPITLRICSVGVLRQAKGHYDALNYKREKYLNLPPRPRGNGNPYFKRKPKEKPNNIVPKSFSDNASPTCQSENSSNDQKNSIQISSIDPSQKLDPHKGGYSQLCGVKLDSVAGKGIQSFKIPKIKNPAPVELLQEEPGPISSIDDDNNEGSVPFKSEASTEKNYLNKESDSIVKFETIPGDVAPDLNSDSDDLDEIIPTSKKARRFRKIIPLIESDSDSDDFNAVSLKSNNVLKKGNIESEDEEKAASIPDGEQMIIDDSVPSDSEDISVGDLKRTKIKKKTASEISSGLKMVNPLKGKNIFKKSMFTISRKDKNCPKRDKMVKSQPVSVSKNSAITTQKSKSMRGRKRGRNLRDSTYHSLHDNDHSELKTTRQKSFLTNEQCSTQKLKVIIPVPLKLVYSFIDEKALLKLPRKKAREIDVSNKQEDIKPILTSQLKDENDANLSLTSNQQDFEESSKLDETIIFSEQEHIEADHDASEILYQESRKRNVSRGRGKKCKRIKQELNIYDTEILSKKRLLNELTDEYDQSCKKQKSEDSASLLADDDFDKKELYSSLSESVDLNMQESANMIVSSKENQTGEIMKSSENIAASKNKDDIVSVFENAADDCDELSDLTQINPTIGDKEFDLYDALPVVKDFSNRISDDPSVLKSQTNAADNFPDKVLTYTDKDKEKQIQRINDELLATVEKFNQQSMGELKDEVSISKIASDDDDDLSLKVNELVESLDRSLNPSTEVNLTCKDHELKDASDHCSVSLIEGNTKVNNVDINIPLTSDTNMKEVSTKTMNNLPSLEQSDHVSSTIQNLSKRESYKDVVQLHSNDNLSTKESEISSSHLCENKGLPQSSYISTKKDLLDSPNKLSQIQSDDKPNTQSSVFNTKNKPSDEAFLKENYTDPNFTKKNNFGVTNENITIPSIINKEPNSDLYMTSTNISSAKPTDTGKLNAKEESMPESCCLPEISLSANSEKISQSENKLSSCYKESSLDNTIQTRISHKTSSEEIKELSEFTQNKLHSKLDNSSQSVEPNLAQNLISKSNENSATKNVEKQVLNETVQLNDANVKYNKQDIIDTLVTQIIPPCNIEPKKNEMASNASTLTEGIPACIMETNNQSRSDLTILSGDNDLKEISKDLDVSNKEVKIQSNLIQINFDEPDEDNDARMSEPDSSNFPDDESVASSEGRDLKTPDSTIAVPCKRGRRGKAPVPPIERRRITRGSMIVPEITEEILWNDGGVVDLFLCDQCNYVGRQRVYHLVNFHSEREIPCVFRKEDFSPVLRDASGPPVHWKRTKPKTNLDWIPKKTEFDEEMDCQERNCDYYSRNRMDFIYHLLEHKPQYANDLYHCRLCNFMSEKLEEFYDHVSSHTGEYRHTCKWCGQKTFSKESLSLHHKNSHKSQDQKFETNSMMLEDDWPYIHICKLCLFVQISSDNCQLHIDTKHNGRGEMIKANMSRHISFRGERKKDEINSRKIKKPKILKSDDHEENDKAANLKKEEKTQVKENNPVFEGQELDKKTEEQERQAEQLVNRLSQNLYTYRSVTKIKKNINALDNILRKVDSTCEDNEIVKETNPDSQKMIPCNSPNNERNTLLSIAGCLNKDYESLKKVKNVFAKEDTNVVPKEQGYDRLTRSSIKIDPDFKTTNNGLDIKQAKINVETDTKSHHLPQLGSLISRVRSALNPLKVNVAKEGTSQRTSLDVDDDDSDDNLVICEDENWEAHSDESKQASSLAGKLRIKSPEELMSPNVNSNDVSGKGLFGNSSPPTKFAIQGDKESDDNFLRIEKCCTLDPKSASQIFKDSPQKSSSDGSLDSSESCSSNLESLKRFRHTPIPQMPVMPRSSAYYAANVSANCAATSEEQNKIENMTKTQIEKKEPSIVVPSASPQHEQVPGIDTLPSDPPTVPILQTFSRFQDSRAFTVYTLTKLSEVFKCMCRGCVFVSNNPEQFKNHLLVIHQNSELRCCYCLGKYSTPSLLIDHIANEHSHCQFQCKYCLYRASSRVYMGVHLKKFHPSKESRYVKVATINKFPPSNPPIDHFVHPYKCTFGKCMFRTVDADAFHNHVNGHHGQNIEIKCFICGRQDEVTKLITHMHDHMMNEFQCPYCLFGEAEREQLLAHLLNCHPGRPGKVLLRKQVSSVPQANSPQVAPTSTSIPIPKNSASLNVSVATKENMNLLPTSSHLNQLPQESKKQFVYNSSHNASSLSFNASCSGPSVTQIAVGPMQANYSSSGENITSNPIAPAVNPQLSMEDTFSKISSMATKDTSLQKITWKSENEKALNALSTIPDPSQNEKSGLSGSMLYRCGNEKCQYSCATQILLKEHLQVCDFSRDSPLLRCFHCSKHFRHLSALLDHIKVHGPKRYFCGLEGCDYKCTMPHYFKNHMKQIHKTNSYKVVSKDFTNKDPETQEYLIYPKDAVINIREPHKKRKNEFAIEDIDKIPKIHILYHDVKCYYCLYSTKIRLNLIKHLNLHKKHPNGIPQKELLTEDTAGRGIPARQPTNPVPRLERKELMFDKMMNLAGSNFETKKNMEISDLRQRFPIAQEELDSIPKYVPDEKVHSCGIDGCSYVSCDETMLKYHIKSLHSDVTVFSCPHCPNTSLSIEKMNSHFKLHGGKLYRCGWCSYLCCRRALVDRHIKDKHAEKKPFDFIIREVEDTTEGEDKPTNIQEKSEMNSLPKQDPQWQCGICPFRTVTQQDMVNHTSIKHDNKSQYKCGYCHVRSSVRTAFDTHFAAKHPNSPFRVLCMYYRLDSEDIEPLPPSNTHEPLWKRNDPDRRRQIRGIMLEDETDKALALLDIEPGTPQDDEFVCPKCLSFKTPCVNTFRSHLCKEANYQRYECVTCALKSPLLPSIRRHITKAHQAEFTSDSYITLPIEGHLEAWVESIISHQQHLVDNFSKGAPVKPSINYPDVASSPLACGPTSNAGRLQSFQSTSSDSPLLEGSEAPTRVMLQGRFTCNICGTECKSAAGLKSHTTSMHGAKYKCQFCPYSSNKELGIKQHCNMKHAHLMETLDSSYSSPKSVTSIRKSFETDVSLVPTTHQDLSPRTKGKQDKFNSSPSKSPEISVVSFRNYVCDYCKKRFANVANVKRHHNCKHVNLTLKYTYKPLVEEDHSSDTETESPSLDNTSSSLNFDAQNITQSPLRVESVKEESVPTKKVEKEEVGCQYVCCYCMTTGELNHIENHFQVAHRELAFLVRKEGSNSMSLETYKFDCDHCDKESVTISEAMDHWMKNHVTKPCSFPIKLVDSKPIIDSGVVEESSKPLSASQTLPEETSMKLQEVEESKISQNESFSDSGRNLVSSSTPDQDQIIKCGYCRKISSSMDQILEHIKQAHNGKPPKTSKYDRGEYDRTYRNFFECLICGKLATSTQLQQHSLEAHPGVSPQVRRLSFKDRNKLMYRCDLCSNYSIKFRPEMILHMQTLHPKDTSKFSLYKGSARETLVPTFKCNYCGDFETCIEDMDRHHTFLHSHLPLSYTTLKGSAMPLPSPLGKDLTEKAVSSQNISPSVSSPSTKKTKFDSFSPCMVSSPKNKARKSFPAPAPKKQIATKSTSGRLQLLRKRPDGSSGSPGGFSYYKKKSPSPDVSDIYARVNLLGRDATPLSVSELSAIVNLKPNLVLDNVKNDEQS